MTDKQKALFRQLQIVVLGLVIGVGGLIADHTPFVIIGICVFVFGTIPSLEDGPEVLWHSIRVDGLFAVYCFGGIETIAPAVRFAL